MSLAAKLNTGTNVTKQVERDTLGGRVLPSAAYPMVIKQAFFDESKGGAMNVTLELESAKGEKLKVVTYFTNKNKETFYTKGDEQFEMPGLSQMQSMYTNAGVEGSIIEADTEEKMVKIYDYTAKTEVPQPRSVLMDLLGKVVVAGVLKVIEDKCSKESNYKTPTGETREINEVDKWFDENGFTTTEREAGLEAPAFMGEWEAKWTGKDKNKAKGVAGAATKGAPAAATTAAKATSLFKKKA